LADPSGGVVLPDPPRTRRDIGHAHIGHAHRCRGERLAASVWRVTMRRSRATGATRARELGRSAAKTRDAGRAGLRPDRRVTARRLVDSKPQDLEQTYPAVADSVRAARCAVCRFAARAGAGPEQSQAVGLAVSEALTNVVTHAYPDGGGTVHITAAVACGELCVLVADEGCGIRPHPPRDGLGLGLTLMRRSATSSRS
jgi:serine/threonine-protein kinase RsbW